MPAREIIEVNFTGRPADVERDLYDAVKSLIGYGPKGWQKIGRTGNPRARFNAPEYSHCALMVLLYKSKSDDHADHIERWLTEQFWHRLANQKAGGGPFSWNTWQYVYLIS